MAGAGDHPRRRAGIPVLETLTRYTRRGIAAATIAASLVTCAPSIRPLGPRVGTPADTPVTLAVVTWNLHAGAGDLPRLTAALAAGELTPTPPRDYVLLIQEAVVGAPSDPAAVARARGLSMLFEAVRTSARRTTGNAILSTTPLTGGRTITLPRARQPRLALTATINIAGQPLSVTNAHLENRVSLWRGLLFSDGARGRQAAALLQQLPAGPGIAGGDLNTWLGRAEPAWRAFAQRFPDAPTNVAEPTFRDRLVLDHLFFDVPDGWQVERRVLRDGYGSDHRPVVGIVRAP